MREFALKRYSVILSLILVVGLASGVANATILNGFQTTNGGQNMTIDLTIDTTLNTVAMTMTGPESVWFAVGFEPLNHPQQASTYAVVPLGGASAPDVEERDLGPYSAGVLLADSLSVDSNTVSAGVRTVELSGLQDGANYTYPTSPETMNIYWAYGSTPDFNIHAGKGETTLDLTAVVPEPATLSLLALAGLGICVLQRRRR
jgi:hypothetical protein